MGAPPTAGIPPEPRLPSGPSAWDATIVGKSLGTAVCTEALKSAAVAGGSGPGQGGDGALFSRACGDRNSRFLGAQQDRFKGDENAER